MKSLPEPHEGAIRHEDRYHRCFLPHPDTHDDPLTSVLREGARRLLAQAVEAEAEAFLSAMAGERLADGRARVVRHGHGPERTIQTGIGAVAVKRAKLRDRGAEAPGKERITFTLAILPKWARRTKSLDALLPVLYLRGISTGDFQEALAALLGKDAPNLSPSVIGRLKEEWQADYDRWQRRDLCARRYVYIWADGVYLQARMEDGCRLHAGRHRRTSNPIESVFATVRHRTVRTKGSLSHKTARLMVFKLVMSAAKTWRRLKGENQLPRSSLASNSPMVSLTRRRQTIAPPDRLRHPFPTIAREDLCSADPVMRCSVDGNEKR